MTELFVAQTYHSSKFVIHGAGAIVYGMLYSERRVQIIDQVAQSVLERLGVLVQKKIVLFLRLNIHESIWFNRQALYRTIAMTAIQDALTKRTMNKARRDFCYILF